MPKRKGRLPAWLPVLLLLAAAAVSAIDLQRVEARTMVIYTTPALQEFLEGSALPAYTKLTGQKVVAVYLNAGSEYNRVKLSNAKPEADLFVQASPLYLEKGRLDGLVDLVTLGNGTYLYNTPHLGGNAWHAFAWSPLVEVHAIGKPLPDLATTDVRFGLAHPQLSNNGIYVAMLLGQFGPELTAHALERTVVQPTNARATIGGVADGSYDVTLGYEAVARYYKSLGAQVVYDVPVVAGERVTAPVLFVAGVVTHHPHPEAERFLRFLMEPSMQSSLAKYGLRAVTPGTPGPTDGIDLNNTRIIDFDWASDWARLEASLPSYEVK